MNGRTVVPVEGSHSLIHSENQQFQLFPWTDRVGAGMAFGTFGELLQGRLWEEQTDFLVTLPIDSYSYAIFVTDPTLPDVRVFPPEKQKSRLLAHKMLAQNALPHGGRLILQSELPMGKGLASSSADLVATANAISLCFHLSIEAAPLAKLMCQIEPSDGVMYPGVVSFHHRQGELREFLGLLPPLTILGIDEGGELDTIQFNKQLKTFTREEEEEYRHLLAVLSRAIRQHDLCSIGQVATRSAVMHQKWNPKQTLDECIAICREIGGLGVVAAHSGTCLGLLLSAEEPRYHTQVQQAYTYLGRLGRAVSAYHSFRGFRELEG
jgi:Protein involved in propanediol utilization, and related proteins (includes coumermycin biosynthetic protein), possible kinase